VTDNTGVCTVKAGLGAKCSGRLFIACQDGQGCLKGPKGATEGICVQVPRKPGETCSYDASCDDQHYCKSAGGFYGFGTCQPLATEGQPCGMVTPTDKKTCIPSLRCYITDREKPGVCRKGKPTAGEKCSISYSVRCAKKFYCDGIRGQDDNVCKPRIQPGGQCKPDFEATNVPNPCIKGYSCYADESTKAMCVKSAGNAVGSKCSMHVRCTESAYCDFISGKTHGICKPKATLNKPCSGPSAIECESGLHCSIKSATQTGTCQPLLGEKRYTCNDVWKCRQGLKCTRHLRNPDVFTCE